MLTTTEVMYVFPVHEAPTLPAWLIDLVVWTLICGWLFIKLAPRLVRDWRAAAAMWFFNKMEPIYLHGESVAALMSVDFFRRLGRYIGNGLCYEVSTLVMMSLKDYPETRLVWADVDFAALRRDEAKEIYRKRYTEWGEDEFWDKHAEAGRKMTDENERFEYMEQTLWQEMHGGAEHDIDGHAWVEMKIAGVWWAIDFAWHPGGVMRPAWMYRQEIHATHCHYFSYEEFWNYAATEKYYQKLQRPETSHLLPCISMLYRRCTYEDGRDPFHFRSFAEVDWLDDFIERTGEGFYVGYVCTYGEKVPISPRIFAEFLMKTRRRQPRRRQMRRAVAIYRRVMRQLQEAERVMEEREG